MRNRELVAYGTAAGLLAAAVALTGCKPLAEHPAPPQIEQQQVIDTHPADGLTPQERADLREAMWRGVYGDMPYSGGDADGPCWEWGAVSQQDAEIMRREYQACMEGRS